jgi:hypothetical protein
MNHITTADSNPATQHPERTGSNAAPSAAALAIQPALFAQPQHQLTSDDYYTPGWIFTALNVKFDLDVAAPPGGSPTVPADHYYTQLDDGLSAIWFGRVWMNPPFSRPEPWMKRFLDHGNGIGLIPFSKSRWFHDAWQTVDAITNLPANLKFIDPRGKNGSIFMPVCLIAMGHDNANALRQIGKVR